MGSKGEIILEAAREFIRFVDRCPSPYHAVDECKKLLLAAGFKELSESNHWNVQPLDKCFVTKNQSTLIAFATGGKYVPGNGFSIIGAHTDSPCLRVKPISRRVKHGYAQVGVECYGGGTWPTWFDRDLKLAGRVLVKNDKQIDHRLVHIDRPIMRVPNIAIHLSREMGTKFELNKETHLVPVLATTVKEQLETGVESKHEVPNSPAQQGIIKKDKHHPVLIKLLSDEMDVKPEQILDFELCLADASPASIGGAFNEFIFAPRLDNLHSSYTALQGLLLTCTEKSLSKETNIRMISLFDNEETGSLSAQGAGSSFQEFVMRRLATGGTATAFEEAIPKSLMISSDMAHAVHPNYGDKHDDQHKPGLHKGIVLKFNCNQKYATTAITTTILRQVAEIADVPLQDFVVRNDSPCGSTIGPIMSAKLGMATIDIGAPQLSMHSIREMGCTSGVQQNIDLFQAFFENYPEVLQKIRV